MTAVVDTSVLIDVLRGRAPAAAVLREQRSRGQVHGSTLTRLEVLAGMRPSEEVSTRAVLATLTWHDIDDDLVEEAAALGRRWLPSHHGIGAVDLVIAATALRLGLALLTTNVRHFPMFEDLQPPY